VENGGVGAHTNQT